MLLEQPLENRNGVAFCATTAIVTLVNTDDLSLLMEVGHGSSLRHVAQQREMTVSTVARRLEYLETRLSLHLVNRTMTGATLTAHGREIARLAIPMAQCATTIERAAALLQAGTSEVFITANEPVIAEILNPALPYFLAKQPELRVELRIQIEAARLACSKADLAIRMARPDDNALLAYKLPRLTLGLFTSNIYLAGRDPARLNVSDERLIGYDESYDSIREMRWLDDVGGPAPFVLRYGSTRELLDATCAGAGLALLPHFLARPAGLVEVLAPRPPPVRTPWLLVNRSLLHLPQIAATRQWIKEIFGEIAS